MWFKKLLLQLVLSKEDYNNWSDKILAPLDKNKIRYYKIWGDVDDSLHSFTEITTADSFISLLVKYNNISAIYSKYNISVIWEEDKKRLNYGLNNK